MRLNIVIPHTRFCRVCVPLRKERHLDLFATMTSITLIVYTYVYCTFPILRACLSIKAVTIYSDNCVPAGDKNRALSSPRPPPLSLTLPTGPEDDEEDDLRFTTNIDFDLNGQNGVKWNESPRPDRLGNKKPANGSPVNLEPTISEDSQLPAWTSESGRVGSSKETIYDFSELGPNSGAPSAPSDHGSFIRPTSANTLYPTLVLETNSENGLVEIVTKLAAPPGGAIEHPQQVIHVSPTSTHHQLGTESTYVSTPASHQTPHPDSNLKKQVQHFNTMLQTTKQTPAGEPGFNTQSIHALPTPPLRPGRKSSLKYSLSLDFKAVYEITNYSLTCNR